MRLHEKLTEFQAFDINMQLNAVIELLFMIKDGEYCVL